MSDAALSPTAPPRLRVGWIVGPGTDLPWFIGGALAGYLLFFLHAGLGWDMLAVWTVWYVTLDGPHFFGTYARTYLDREEFRRRRGLLLGSLGLFLVGPLLLGVAYLLHASGHPQLATAPFGVLIAFVGVWAYWHVVRQHYGILALYRRKNDDFAPADVWTDNVLLYVGLLAPFVAFAVRLPEARSQLGYLGLSLDTSGLGGLLIAITAVAVLAAAVAFAFRQVQRWQLGLPLNLPKLLFLAAVVPLHLLICYHPATLTAGLLGFSAFVTIFHDLQYHAIVWHYQRNRCHRPGADPKRFGAAWWLSRHLGIYLGCAVLMALIGWRIGCAFSVVPTCLPAVEEGGNGWRLACAPEGGSSLTLFWTGGVVLFGHVTLWHLLVAVFLGLVMHHYLVDQFIWRPSKDAELRKDLNVGGPQSETAPAASK
jgi:hypothetical protein